VTQLNPILSTKRFFKYALATTVTFLILSSSTFAFTDLKGEKIEIEKQLGKGKWSIVEVWASDCGACRAHMPSMVEFDKKIGSGDLKNARIIGITVDGQQGISDAKSFIKEYNIKFQNIVSNPIETNAWMLKTVGEAFIGTPTFMIFDDKGKLVAAQPGAVKTDSLETFIKENSKTEESTQG